MTPARAGAHPPATRTQGAEARDAASLTFANTNAPAGRGTTRRFYADARAEAAHRPAVYEPQAHLSVGGRTCGQGDSQAPPAGRRANHGRRVDPVGADRDEAPSAPVAAPAGRSRKNGCGRPGCQPGDAAAARFHDRYRLARRRVEPQADVAALACIRPQRHPVVRAAGAAQSRAEAEDEQRGEKRARAMQPGCRSRPDGANLRQRLHVLLCQQLPQLLHAPRRAGAARAGLTSSALEDAPWWPCLQADLTSSVRPRSPSGKSWPIGSRRRRGAA